MRIQNVKHQTGFTLIELMVGMVVGLIILSGVLFGYLQIVSATQSTIASTRLNTELSNVAGIIAGELRRSGYSASSEGGVYQTGTQSLTVSSSSCALYSYDANSNADLDNDEEQRGFKWESGTDVVYWGKNVTSCDAASGWFPLTASSKINITSLTFTCVLGCDDGGAVRKVEVLVEATDSENRDFFAKRKFSVLLPNNEITD